MAAPLGCAPWHGAQRDLPCSFDLNPPPATVPRQYVPTKHARLHKLSLSISLKMRLLRWPPPSELGGRLAFDSMETSQQQWCARVSTYDRSRGLASKAKEQLDVSRNGRAYTQVHEVWLPVISGERRARTIWRHLAPEHKIAFPNSTEGYSATAPLCLRDNMSRMLTRRLR